MNKHSYIEDALKVLDACISFKASEEDTSLCVSKVLHEGMKEYSTAFLDYINTSASPKDYLLLIGAVVGMTESLVALMDDNEKDTVSNIALAVRENMHISRAEIRFDDETMRQLEEDRYTN